MAMFAPSSRRVLHGFDIEVERWLAPLVLACTLLSAVTSTAAQSTPSGPTVSVYETTIEGGKGGSTFFVITKIDGREVPSGIDASLRASAGRGAELRIQRQTQSVPAGVPVTLTIVGQYVYAMPIAQIISGGRHAVSGDVRVELLPGSVYRVNGVLDSYRSEVWIQDLNTDRVVGEKVVRPASAREVADAAGADRYTCCNLHHDGGWISDSNYTGQAFIPAGARVKVTGWGRHRVHANIGGRSISAGVDFGRALETREQLAERLFVSEDPRRRMESWSAEVREAIDAGKARRGMTKEQLVVSLGEPRKDRTPDLAATRWIYFFEDGEEFDIRFDADGRVEALNGPPRARHSAWIE